MGESCIRFTTPDDLALGVIRDVVSRTSVDDFIAIHKSGRGT